jgi:hypothetical protein
MTINERREAGLETDIAKVKEDDHEVCIYVCVCTYVRMYVCMYIYV